MPRRPQRRQFPSEPTPLASETNATTAGASKSKAKSVERHYPRSPDGGGQAAPTVVAAAEARISARVSREAAAPRQLVYRTQRRANPDRCGRRSGLDRSRITDQLCPRD